MKRQFNQNIKNTILTVIDLETTGLDTKNGSEIISVGMVTFDPSKEEFTILDHLYLGIKSSEYRGYGLTVDSKTMSWHESLGKEIFEHHQDLREDGNSLEYVLNSISNYISKYNELAEKRGINHFVIGNAPEFDQGMLEILFNKKEIQVPWEFWQNLDYRTISYFVHNESREERNEIFNLTAEIVSDMKILPRNLCRGHVAIVDAISEAISVHNNVKRVNNERV